MKRQWDEISLDNEPESKIEWLYKPRGRGYSELDVFFWTTLAYVELLVVLP